MAVTMTFRWDDVGTLIPVGQAKYAVNEQPIAEYDNWAMYTLAADIQAVIDDVINKFNANTILKADTDNTPAALAVGANTIVGRAAGTISALTDSEVRAIINVEDGSTADQTNAEIRAAVEAATDSNVFTDADHTKLNGVATGAEVNLFEEVANVLREKSGGGYDNDFVIGSPQLDDDGNVLHDARMWFDKSKRAFRAGEVTGSEWDAISVGNFSSAFGYNTTSSGTGSHAEGYNTEANSNYSHAEGYNSVASGNCSHAEGINSVASNVGAHAEGDTALSSGWVAHAGGYQSSAYLYCHFARSAGRFSTTGDAQYSDLLVRKSTTDATQTELTLDGGVPDADSRMILPANRTWAFTINIAARQTAGSGTIGDSGIYKIEGGIKRDGANNTVLVGVITKTTLAEDQASWDVTAEADDTNECLVIKVTGEASKTIHWVAKVDLVEVG